MDFIDAQIHDMSPTRPIDAHHGEEVQLLVGVEMAREALDSVGVDAALVFASKPYIDACVDRYPDRFAGVITFDCRADDLEEQVANLRMTPGLLAGRNAIGEPMRNALRPDYLDGSLNRLYSLAEKYGVPLFFSTHGWAHVLEKVAREYPDLTMIIDHLGLKQSPVSPVPANSWSTLPGLLSLARFTNVNVKMSGVPLMSNQSYPYSDVWPYLHQVIDAFGPDRIMWGTDFTRMRWLPETGRELAPRSNWIPYSDCVNFLRDTKEISENEKAKLFGGTIRRVLSWDI